MLLSPVVLDALAQGTIAYTDLHVSTWGSSGTTITYTYDDNGSVESKITNDGTNDTEIVDYTYNLQNRLETVTTAGALADLDSDTYVDDRIVEVTTYTYNPAGIRVKSESINYNVYDYDIPATELWEKQYNGVTDYLIDPYNHTGYAQVLEETTIDYDDLDVEIQRTRIQYTIGDDVISQTESTWSGSAWVLADTQYLLYDGHGSTRQLLDHTYAVDGGGKAIIDDCYSYDGYGVMLGGNPTASSPEETSMLYAGEQFDENLSQYYLRARYYDQNTGRFNRTDPFAGNTQDPQSLHKYAYCHANPTNATDPSGEFSTINLVVAFAVYVAIAVPGMYLYNWYSPYKERVRKKFDRWYKRQTIGWWIGVLPKCPKTIGVSGGNPSYNGPDKEKWEKPKRLIADWSPEERLHPGIVFSMRSKVFQGHTNQATYDAFGNLYTEYPMAGTVDWRRPGTWAHYKADVRPLHWAVYLDHEITMHVFWGPKTPKGAGKIGPYMKKYYEKRPIYY